MSRTVRSTAERIASGITMKEEESKKKITRFQMSLLGVAEIADCDYIDSQFMVSLNSELRNFGWCCFQVTHTTYAFISLKSARKFRQISGAGMKELMTQY